MNLLTIDKLTKQFGERLLFQEADLRINAGDRIGLIGVNGSGKTTLLRIIAGLEAPDSGSLTVWGGVKIEYLEQEPQLDDRLSVLATIFHSDSPQMLLLRSYEEAGHTLEQDPLNATLQQEVARLGSELTRTDGWAAEANAKSILTRLGITNFVAPVGTLSGGQRKRVALARALIDRADLLILDEPTNHIDVETVTWLEEYLAKTPGALLMVTHDRYFLDRVVNQIVELDRRQLVGYPGNYTKYLEEREARRLRLAAAEGKQRKLLSRELEWLRRSPMARGTKQKARKQRVEELMQIQYDSGESIVAMTLAGRRLGKDALSVRDLSLAFGPHKVVDQIDLELSPGDRIGIIGPNGAGKSTLLHLLAGRLQPDAGEIRWGDTVQLGYYDQMGEALDDQMRVIEFIENEAPLLLTKDGERIEAAKMLEWFLFPRPMQWGRIGSLSGGERRRLYLLRTLAHQPNILILDEPTNDLDIQMLTVLEEYLDYFSGCLIVVSHDRYFLDRTVDYLISMEDGHLGPRYPTPYSTFARLREEAASAQTPYSQPTLPSQPSGKATPEPSRKLTWKQQKELAKLEAEIETLEQAKSALVEAMAASGEDYQKLTTLAATMQTTDQALDAALEQWVELSELAAVD